MRENRQLIPKWQAPGAANEIYPPATAASLASVTVRVFLKYWKIGLYQPLGDIQRNGFYFDVEAIYLARQAELMRQELGVDMKVAALIVKLRQEVASLRQELDFWRG